MSNEQLIDHLLNPQRLYVDHDGQALVLDPEATERLLAEAAGLIQRLLEDRLNGKRD